MVFDEVAFQYPETARTALDKVSLEIKPGEVAALVGPNGSGKTTLVKLLCRLYDPPAGSHHHRRHRPARVGPDRSAQEHERDLPGLFAVPAFARQNIWVGNIDLDPQGTAIEEAARDAGADGVIRGLRHGYDTMLGKWFRRERS